MESLKHQMRQLFDRRNGSDIFDMDKKLADDLVRKIVNLSILNPSAFGDQPCSILAVKSQQAKYKLYKSLGDYEKIIDTAVALIIVDNTVSMNLPLMNLSIMYASKYYAVDYFSLSNMNFEPVKISFDLAPHTRIAMIACLGYFNDAKYQYPQQHRFSYSDVVKEI